MKDLEVFSVKPVSYMSRRPVGLHKRGNYDFPRKYLLKQMQKVFLKNVRGFTLKISEEARNPSQRRPNVSSEKSRCTSQAG